MSGVMGIHSLLPPYRRCLNGTGGMVANLIVVVVVVVVVVV